MSDNSNSEDGSSNLSLSNPKTVTTHTNKLESSHWMSKHMESRFEQEQSERTRQGFVDDKVAFRIR